MFEIGIYMQFRVDFHVTTVSVSSNVVEVGMHVCSPRVDADSGSLLAPAPKEAAFGSPD